MAKGKHVHIATISGKTVMHVETIPDDKTGIALPVVKIDNGHGTEWLIFKEPFGIELLKGICEDLLRMEERKNDE